MDKHIHGKPVKNESSSSIHSANALDTKILNNVVSPDPTDTDVRSSLPGLEAEANPLYWRRLPEPTK